MSSTVDRLIMKRPSFAELFNLDNVVNFPLPNVESEETSDLEYSTSESSFQAPEIKSYEKPKIEADQTQNVNSTTPKSVGSSKANRKRKHKEDAVSLPLVSKRKHRSTQKLNGLDLPAAGKATPMSTPSIAKKPKPDIFSAMASRTTCQFIQKYSTHNTHTQSKSSTNEDPEKSKTHGRNSLIPSSTLPDDSDLLNLGRGVIYSIPPFYDQLPASMKIPDFERLKLDENVLLNALNQGNVLALIAKMKPDKSNAYSNMFYPHDSMMHFFDSIPFSSFTPPHQMNSLHIIQPPTDSHLQSSNVIQPSSAHLDEATMNITSQITPIADQAVEVLAEEVSHELTPERTHKTPSSSEEDTGVQRMDVEIVEKLDFDRDGEELINSEEIMDSSLEKILPRNTMLVNIPVEDLSEKNFEELLWVDTLSLPDEDLEEKIDAEIIEKKEREICFKTWQLISKKEIPKYAKQFSVAHKKNMQECKRISELCQKEVKNRTLRSLKIAKTSSIRVKRLAKDMIILWKKMDKEQTEIRKREEREAIEQRKKEEELRETKRQQQRLNFLLTQTELYTHFMQAKLNLPSKSARVTRTEQGYSEKERTEIPVNSNEADALEDEKLRAEAVEAAKTAADEQWRKTNSFDDECKRLRVGNIDEEEEEDKSKDLDLLHPSTMPSASSVSQPSIFLGKLKEYQLKGLQWLVNLYEQGLNGILADEMGLGKTIQAMSFLAHLAEEKDIWGPFLIVAPASVLNNWADELAKFLPSFKVMPYWGGLQERTILRKNINPKRLYKKEGSFHALVTSYQLLVQDEKFFRKVKWQYMVLDEAQAIKSSNSIRWKTLLSFNCRNRLLLTGTPIQNNMAELWALLHFIMPTLFDSHEQFNEWFSKGIESHAEHGNTLNEHQLYRLHSILKPFMLRRIKKDVETEMTEKKEYIVPCRLNKRQNEFYKAIKNKISLQEIFDSGNISEKRVLNLMNIVIQLRKVCNHPELFERNEGKSFFHFASVPNPLVSPPFGELEHIYFSGHRSCIQYQIPKLLFREGMICLPSLASGSVQDFRDKWISNQFSIFSSQNIHDSIFHAKESEKMNNKAVRKNPMGGSSHSAFGFSRFIHLSPSEIEFLAKSSFLEGWIFSLLHKSYVDFHLLREEDERYGVCKEELKDERKQIEIREGISKRNETRRNHGGFLDVSDEDGKSVAVKKLLFVSSYIQKKQLFEKQNFMNIEGDWMPPFPNFSTMNSMLEHVMLLRSTKVYMPEARAPQFNFHCHDNGFQQMLQKLLYDPYIMKLLVGHARTSKENADACHLLKNPKIDNPDVEKLFPYPLFFPSFRIFGSSPPMQSFDFAKMLMDSGKLQTLDILLRKLRSEGHRVLLFAQMTKMLNILEDYMKYRKYKYLRLDGSSTIIDRRDMVKEYQSRSDIFVFLLSTRAGGIGINLTAADTVIFYESDWNPTMDLQAMDRAHRLGQTREVTVYRMICQGTVEEKILKRASEKNTVQQLVITGNQNMNPDVFNSEDVVSLLLDDAEMEQKMRNMAAAKQEKKRKRGSSFLPSLGVRIDAEGMAALEEMGDKENQKEKEKENENRKGKKKMGRAQKNKKGETKEGSDKIKLSGALEMDEMKQLQPDNSTMDSSIPPKRTKRKSASESKPPKPPKLPKIPKAKPLRIPKLSRVTKASKLQNTNNLNPDSHTQASKKSKPNTISDPHDQASLPNTVPEPQPSTMKIEAASNPSGHVPENPSENPVDFNTVSQKEEDFHENDDRHTNPISKFKAPRSRAKNSMALAQSSPINNSSLPSTNQTPD